MFWIEQMLPRAQVRQVLSHATVFACPSVYEPLGIVNLEAMACETAVVASAVGGIPEVVVDGETGYLVPYDPAQADDPAAVAEFERGLADKINALTRDPDKARRSARPAGSAASTSSAGPRSPRRPSTSTGRPSRSTGAETRYADRTDAGRRLAELIDPLTADALVLALPRGGIPVAAPIAARFGVGLWTLAVRKIGAPGHPELAMGAVAAVGDRVEEFRNEALLAHLGVSAKAYARQRLQAEAELAEVVARYGGAPDVAGRRVILVDDGLATGATMSAAVQALIGLGVTGITVAVPVAPRAAVARLADRTEVVCPYTPGSFVAVGQAYDDFRQVSDDEVRALLAR